MNESKTVESTAQSVCAQCRSRLDSTIGGESICTNCLLRSALDQDDYDPDKTSRRSDQLIPGDEGAPIEFGDYELLEELGRGSQGVVYRARQKSLNRTVALKVIAYAQLASKAHVKRFRREAEAAASLDHSCIVPIYEVGERDGCCYFSMKFVEGGQLDEVVRRTPLSLRQAAELIAKVARTAHYAHEHNILHRDIKPGNILLDQKGEPHLTDFGLARLVETESTITRTREIMGTPSYMAPEQAAGETTKVNRATDVYGLGAVLYQLLTSHPPFAGGTSYETIRLLLDTEPRQPRLWNRKIDRELSTICLKCLEKDSKRRYPSALALAEDLEHWLKHEPIRARRTGVFTHARKWVRRNPSIAVMAAMLLVLAVPLGVIIWKSEFVRQPVTTGIAVLPFENLSDSKENAFFADGVQDDILTMLAKIADLKVISRTSVLAYRGARNTQQIGHALNVSHVLEGSVRKNAGRIHLNAQLIDTRTDMHVWAEEYDRDLADVFAIQSEIAQQIAATLKAKLAPEEKARLEAKPTDNPEAYALYLKALGRERAVNLSVEDLTAAEPLYAQAIALDPKFALVHARLSIVNSLLASELSDNRSTLRAKARAAAEEALRLSPSLGEAHMARGLCLYYAERDYAAALKEFSIAAATLPNEPDIFRFIGAIYRRQGRWRESLATYQRAQDRDPRNRYAILASADTDLFVRDWAGATAHYDRDLEIEPNSVVAKISLAYIEVFRNGNPTAGRKLLQNIPAGIDPDGIVTESRWDLAMLERDYASAEKILSDSPLAGFPRAGEGAKAFFQGRTALARGDVESAQRYFATAASSFERQVRDDPYDASRHARLGLLYAYMHKVDDAIREGRLAVDFEPESRDAILSAGASANLALVYALLGKPDQAIPLIERLLSIPGPLDWPDFPQSITLADLRLRWEWDSLRSNPRFQKILAGPELKTVY